MDRHIYHKTYLLICYCLLIPTCFSFYFKTDWIGPLQYSKMIVCGDKYIIYSNQTNKSTSICLNNFCISIPELRQGYSFACSQYDYDYNNYLAVKINTTDVKLWKIYQEELISVNFQLNASKINSTIRSISVYQHFLAVAYDVAGSTSFIDVYIIRYNTQSYKVKTISFLTTNCSAYLNNKLNMIVLCEDNPNDTLYVYQGPLFQKSLSTSFYACAQYSFTKRYVQLPDPTLLQEQNNIKQKIYIIYQDGKVACNYEINIIYNIDGAKMLEFINDTDAEKQYGWRYYCNGRKFYHPYVDSYYINQKYNYSIYPDVFVGFFQPIKDVTCTPMHGGPWTTNNVVLYLHSYSSFDYNKRYIDVYQEYSLIPILIIASFLFLVMFLKGRLKLTVRKIYSLLFVSFHRQQIDDFLLKLQSEQ